MLASSYCLLCTIILDRQIFVMILYVALSVFKKIKLNSNDVIKYIVN